MRRQVVQQLLRTGALLQEGSWSGARMLSVVRVVSRNNRGIGQLRVVGWTTLTPARGSPSNTVVGRVLAPLLQLSQQSWVEAPRQLVNATSLRALASPQAPATFAGGWFPLAQLPVPAQRACSFWRG